MKIRAAVLEEIGTPRPYAETKPLKIQELDLDPPGEGEVLVKVAAAGLCHSDLSVINGDRPRPTPMALGHEAAGVVAELGPGVDDLAVGDHVVLVFVPSCGHCRPCAEGRPALCEPAAKANAAGEMLGGGRRLHRDGQDVHHHLGVSCFADHAVCSRRSLIRIDKAVPLEQAALFGCAVQTGVGAVVNTAHVPAGSDVAVVGLGGVGLNALLAAKLSGAARIVAMDLLDDKLALARQLGATHTVNAGYADAADQVRAATDGGADFAFEMAGSVPALDLAYKVTRRGGTTVTAGLANPDKRLELAPVSLVAEERTLKGSYIGSCVPVRDIPRFLTLFRQGQLPVDRLMSERVTLDTLNESFDRLADGGTVRQVLTFD
ncbi:zinc-dependent alcohol dehydrogenase family protein [Ferruginivarius sediminum]|uniref:Alcohol dehydrogenase n=1 Tax=Ferruginivarius sediminum TaxID=2661937 RepID=A0A369TBI1_9PROT|nr:zinc-dependent alcohol dehydrogenase family protein [Ferruginivarius sediminum]RDD61537.1 alcohol dehydrogenase [Ferruginivarius sediminum]